MRDEVALERGLAALKTEVAEARRLQPNFEGKLNVLQGQIEKVQKTTSRLRAEQSTLEFKQRKVVQDTTVKLTWHRQTNARSVAAVAREWVRVDGRDAVAVRAGIVTVPDNPVRMDIPAVRAARIELRVGELRVLVARTAVAVLALTPDGAWRRH